MGKKKKRKHRHAPEIRYGENRHHLIFQARHWNHGYSKLLREHMTRMLDVNIHSHLHNFVLHDVPKPSDAEIKRIWLKYQEESWYVDQLDIVSLADWLAKAADDAAFRACMVRQRDYLYGALSKRGGIQRPPP